MGHGWRNLVQDGRQPKLAERPASILSKSEAEFFMYCKYFIKSKNIVKWWCEVDPNLKLPFWKKLYLTFSNKEAKRGE